MKRIVLIRHGESQWNKENRFTGWTNVDLSEKGVQEALDAGKALKEAGITFEVAYTSYLKRAIKTLNNVLDAMDLDWIPVKKTWRLNEKHYGMLQGTATSKYSSGAAASTWLLTTFLRTILTVRPRILATLSFLISTFLAQRL